MSGKTQSSRDSSRRESVGNIFVPAHVAWVPVVVIGAVAAGVVDVVVDSAATGTDVGDVFADGVGAAGDVGVRVAGADGGDGSANATAGYGEGAVAVNNVVLLLLPL
ncbi:Hypothetical predicted protein [Octopus vulgaris]|uniref:Uncharacterized protein n=1 Tax=Octopus vulgaris TaxID=6645 RepID=A0AA36FF06_OCTVU|nr:Hypothetical predicted protein [Octopus vulgaris]